GGDVLPRAAGAWAMGPEAYARWLRATTGDSTPIAALRERAERELASAEHDATPWGVLRDDSVRAAVADSMLDARAERGGRGASRWMRTVLGRRELAFAWTGYAARANPSRRGRAAESPQGMPSRLDLVGLVVEIDLQTGGASIDDARSRLIRYAGLD